MSTAKKEEKNIPEEPFDFERAQINLHISLYPKGADDATRRASIGISSHGDMPVIEFHENAAEMVAQLPEILERILAEFESKMPDRYLAHLRRLAETGATKKRKPKSTPATSRKTTAGSKKPAKKVTAQKKMF
jgi:hypothetical protein